MFHFNKKKIKYTLYQHHQNPTPSPTPILQPQDKTNTNLKQVKYILVRATSWNAICKLHGVVKFLETLKVNCIPAFCLFHVTCWSITILWVWLWIGNKEYRHNKYEIVFMTNKFVIFKKGDQRIRMLTSFVNF